MNVLGLWTLLFLTWLAATSSLDIAAVTVGAIFTLALASRFHRNCRSWASFRATPRALIGFIAYLPIFGREMVKANLAMLRYVYVPKLAINPGVVTIRTALRTPIARLTLANTIALTPGTIVLDMDGDRLRVHWIDVQTHDIDGATRAIVGPFETVVRAGFE